MRQIFGKNGPTISDKNLGRNWTRPKRSRKRAMPSSEADHQALKAAADKRARVAARNLRNASGEGDR